MAQASSAPAREPSMEEILASIRRIIEDSDSARRADDDLHDAGASAQAGTVAEFSREAEDMTGNEDSVSEVEAFRSELTAPAVEPPVRMNGHEANGAIHALGRPGAVSEQHVEARPTSDPDRPSPMRQHDESREDDSGSRGAIISEFAGRQVAAAFEELSEAFSASRKRSYDEIAEEIMRPMLQDWLDNNLPLLVERLVREEIERVARGGVR